MVESLSPLIVSSTTPSPVVDAPVRSMSPNNRSLFYMQSGPVDQPQLHVTLSRGGGGPGCACSTTGMGTLTVQWPLFNISRRLVFMTVTPTRESVYFLDRALKLELYACMPTLILTIYLRPGITCTLRLTLCYTVPYAFHVVHIIIVIEPGESILYIYIYLLVLKVIMFGSFNALLAPFMTSFHFSITFLII